MVVATLQQNAHMAQQVIAGAVERLPIDRGCDCARALASAIITRSDDVPMATKLRLEAIIGRYMT
jgi:hypothetical protein